MSRRPLLIGGLALAIIIALLTATSFLQRTTARAPALASRSDSSPSATPPPSQTDDAPTSQAAPATTQCSRTLSGTQSVDIDFDGTTYPVQVHVPETADPEAPLPLVMDLHDSDSNGVFQSSISELDAIADADETGFIVARPSAATAVDTSSPLADGNWAWSIPGAPTVAGQTPPGGARDDVAFLSAVIEQLTTQGCVDSQRVYLTGFSGGGRMASAYACARPDLVAAIAPVAGLRAGSPAERRRGRRVHRQDPSGRDARSRGGRPWRHAAGCPSCRHDRGARELPGDRAVGDTHARPGPGSRSRLVIPESHRRVLQGVHRMAPPARGGVNRASPGR